MTAVMAVAVPSAPFLGGRPAPYALPGGLEPEQLPDVCETVRRLLEQGPVVAVVPAWADQRVRERLATLRVAADASNLAIHETELSPLAAGVLAGYAAALADLLPDVGVLLAALEPVARQLITVTWLHKLTGLTTPAPSMAQHAASLLPHTAWAVTSWPEPAILRVGSDPLRLPAMRSAVGVAIADHGGDAAWMHQAVLSQLPEPHPVLVEPSPAAPAWWGTRRVTEAVLYPLAVDAVAHVLAQRLESRPCAWCHEPTATALCPFCRLPSVGSVALGYEANDQEVDLDTLAAQDGAA